MSRKFPIVNYLFIAANIAVFFLQFKLGLINSLDQFIYKYSVIPAVFLKDPLENAYRLITSQFLHGGLMHIIGNMVFLYIFGDNVEDRFGHIPYIFFYLVSGVAASAGQIYFYPNSQMPMLGASGAIAGVLGAYFLFYPKARVMTLIPLGFFSRIVEIPAFFFLGLWFLMQTFSGTSALYLAHVVGHDVGGVAWWAHIGGFIFGFLAAIVNKIL